MQVCLVIFGRYLRSSGYTSDRFLFAFAVPYLRFSHTLSCGCVDECISKQPRFQKIRIYIVGDKFYAYAMLLCLRTFLITNGENYFSHD